MERESGRDRSIEGVDPAAGSQAADGAACAPDCAAHAFVFVAHHQNRRPRELELTDALRSVSV